MPFLTLDSRAEDGRQLVATLGPRSAGLAAALARAGATAFRVNASHTRPARLAEMIDDIRGSCPDAPILVDLQGAKMRLGWIEERRLAAAERVRFAIDPSAGISLPHRELFEQVQARDVVSVDDGRVRLEVLETGDQWFDSRALTPGTLSARKGVNVEQHPVRLDGLVPSDAEALALAWARGVRAFAFSFMADGSEARWVRERAPGALVVGKVERAEAVRQIDAIAGKTEAVWICRGDLGAQLGAARLAHTVAAIVPGDHRVPVLMAGQVLQHLVDHDEPSRSEVCHVHDLLARGYAGLVLSDETALGRDPVRAVEAASALLRSLTLPAPAGPRST